MNVALSLRPDLEIGFVRPQNCPNIEFPFLCFSLPPTCGDVAAIERRLRRRIYAQRITNPTTATAPMEAPIAAAMISFFESSLVCPLAPSPDICVDRGSVFEEVVVCKAAVSVLEAPSNVAARAVMLDVEVESVGRETEDVALVMDDSSVTDVPTDETMTGSPAVSVAADVDVVVKNCVRAILVHLIPMYVVIEAAMPV